MSTSVYFADLTSPDVEKLRQQPHPVVLLLPVGATEPHGPHAPLSTDSLISTSTCERVAQRLADDRDVHVFILPTIPYGVTTYAAAFAGVIHVSAETLRAMVADICRSLSSQGLPRIVVVNNHFEPEHLRALQQAVVTVNGEGASVVLLDVLRRHNVERLTQEFQAGESHASSYETSIVLAERPDLVDVERMRELPPVKVDMARAIVDGLDEFVAMGMDDAYCGDPARATAEEGEATLAILTDMVIDLVREVALRQGGDARD